MKFIALLANTARSQAYLQTLIKENLKPARVFIMDDDNKKTLGKIKNNKNNFNKGKVSYSFKFSVIDPQEDLLSTLSKTDIPYTIINSSNINSEDVYYSLLKCDENFVVISVYAGQILRNKILSLNKKFIHVHSGKLPYYRGSTTLYYSLLEINKVAASAIIIDQGIDTGELICFKEYDFNFNPELIDLIFDPLLRAVVLVYAIKQLIQNTKNSNLQDKLAGNDYYVIHPLLKHLVILKESNK